MTGDIQPEQQEQNMDENEKFVALAQEMSVPVEYLRLGYAISGDFLGQHLPKFTTFEEFRAGLLENSGSALAGKVLLMLFQSETKTLKFGEAVYHEKDLNELKKRVEAWAVANGAQKQGGCYVATAVYGSYDCPQVWTLRRYRDNRLGSSRRGRLFIRAYYAVSPTLVRCFAGSSWFNAAVRPPLDRLVGRLRCQGYDDAPYYD
jgi:hypothetical protein